MKNNEVVKSLKNLLNLSDKVVLKIMVGDIMFYANHIENINGSIVIGFREDK